VHWDCDAPMPGTGGAEFRACAGSTIVSPGDDAQLGLDWQGITDLGDRTAVLGVYDEPGHFAVGLGSAPRDPAPFVFSIADSMPGDAFTAWIGIDEGMGTPDA
jgi:hypothetical protein